MVHGLSSSLGIRQHKPVLTIGFNPSCLCAKTGLFSPQPNLIFSWPGTSHVNSPQVPEGRVGGCQSRGQPYSSPLNYPPSHPLPTCSRESLGWQLHVTHTHTQHSRQSADREATPHTVARSQWNLKVGEKQINNRPQEKLSFEPFLLVNILTQSLYLFLCETMKTSLPQLTRW